MGERPSGGHKVFVGSLPGDCTEEELRMVFGTYGEITDLALLGASPRTGQRCAFVNYRRYESADEAIKLLNGQYKIRVDADRPIDVRWPRDRNQGPPGRGGGDWGSAPQYDARGRGGGGGGGGCGGGGGGGYSASGSGYSANAGGYSANAGSHSASAGGWGHSGGAAASAAAARPQQPASEPKLFVGNLPSDILEEELRHVFGTYGEVTNVHVMKPAPTTGHRCAFVAYSRRESAEQAMALLNGQYKIRTDPNAETLTVKWAKERSDGGGGKGGGSDWSGGGGGGGSWGGGGGGSQGGGWKGWSSPTGNSAGNWQQDKGCGGWQNHGTGKGGGGKSSTEGTGTRLYVANLPEGIDNATVEFVFKTYGKVTNVHVMGQKAVKGCVSAFVDYSNPQEAQVAINTLDGKYEIQSGMGPITVKRPMPKDKGQGKGKFQPY